MGWFLKRRRRSTHHNHQFGFPIQRRSLIILIGILVTMESLIVVEAHWINLHVWYDEITEQQHTGGDYSSLPTYIPRSSGGTIDTNSTLLHSTFNTTKSLDVSRHSQLMQQDAAVTHSMSHGRDESKPESLFFHQPRPLPPCDQLPGLTQPQIDICRVFTDHMRSIIQGAKLGLTECRWQFRYNHWNCSSPPIGEEEKPPPSLIQMSEVKSSRSLTRPGRKRSLTSTPTPRNDEESRWNSILKYGSKEVAFAHAIWSAAVTQAIARTCRDGSLSSCACGKSARPVELKDEWRWGGCSDNLQYGYKFATEFVDSREKEKTVDRKASAKALANLHNNEAGRRAVLKKTKIACKCHGVSGSCVLVTCWHQVPSFRDIGDELKERYAASTLVKMNRRGRLQVKRAGDKVPSVHDLVYVDNSPNYCVQNESLGVTGTTGRYCNRNSTGPDGCKSLCCNKGSTTTVVKKSTRCQCKFVWCCQVVCQECKKVQKISTCK